MFNWLETAMDSGLSEFDFWQMTLAEVIRFIDSKKRIQKREAQEKATFDYIQADLIGRSLARVYSSSNKIPPIEEVYPSLFNNEEIKDQKQENKMNVSALRFKQFAQSYNSRLNKEVANR